MQHRRPSIMQSQLVRWRSARASRSTARGKNEKQEEMSLLRFPDEILLQVVEELGETELYTLCLVNKRCQRLALPLYLLRHGFDVPLNVPIDRLTFSAEQLMTLPGLRLVLVTKPVRSLFCKFNARNCTAVALSYLHRMIANSNSLEDVALQLDTWYLRLPKPLSEVSFRLVEVIAQRCTSLKLSEHDVYRETIPLEWQLLEQRTERELRTAQWESGDRFHAHRNSGSFNPPGKSVQRGFLHSIHSWLLRALGLSEQKSPQYALKTLVLRSQAFLLPPYTGWAFRLLSTVPLTRLDLLDISLSSRESVAIFGALTVPTLQHLCVIACRFDFHPFTQFLSRHDTISVLNLVYMNMQRLPRGTLPGLVSLKSVPNNLHYLLMGTDTFPELAQVQIVLYLSQYDQFTFSSVERSLAEVARRLVRTNIRIGLEVFPSSYTDSWINLWDYPCDYHVLSRVQEIAFGMPHPDIVSSSAIPEWLSLFPDLEHVEFLDGPNDLSRKSKIALLRCIIQQSPEVRSAKIDKETRDVVSWLAEDA